MILENYEQEILYYFTLKPTKFKTYRKTGTQKNLTTKDRKFIFYKFLRYRNRMGRGGGIVRWKNRERERVKQRESNRTRGRER